jgi:hypothetical protein
MVLQNNCYVLRCPGETPRSGDYTRAEPRVTVRVLQKTIMMLHKCYGVISNGYGATCNGYGVTRNGYGVLPC